VNVKKIITYDEDWNSEVKEYLEKLLAMFSRKEREGGDLGDMEIGSEAGVGAGGGGGRGTGGGASFEDAPIWVHLRVDSTRVNFPEIDPGLLESGEDAVDREGTFRDKEGGRGTRRGERGRRMRGSKEDPISSADWLFSVTDVLTG
jgi:hypothetical protein